jgi:hypothetical protein
MTNPPTSALNDIDILAADAGNAYLNAPTHIRLD